MASPSLRSLGTVVSGTTTAPSFAAPAGAASTDVIIIAVFVDDGRSTISAAPSGFSQAASSPQVNDAAAGSPSHCLFVYWGRFSDVGSGPYGFTISSPGTPFVEGRAAAVQGCITTGNPFEATNGATSGNTNVTTAPSVSAASLDVDRYAFYAATNWTGGAWTPASGFVEQWDANSQIITFDDKALATAQTVTPQAVCAGSGRSNAWVGILLPVPAAAVIAPPARTVQGRDPGEAWWVQRDRRDANTVATAANPLPSPLDSAWRAGARYWHLYGDAADVAPRTWQSLQRLYVSDPNLLAAAPAAVPYGPQRTVAARDPGEAWWQQLPGRDPVALGQPLLENELLGSVDDLRRRYLEPAYGDRREVPQQRTYVSDPLLLTAALLENELLGGAGAAQRANAPATHAPRWWMPQQPARQVWYFDAGPDVPPLTVAFGDGGGYWARYNQAGWQPDRREVPQQRAYISDPSFYPTIPPLDPLTVAWGAGGAYWWLYNTAAGQVDRREVPQQRRYVSDPATLAGALLENELLGGADDRWRRYGQWPTDRRQVPQQRAYLSDPTLLGPPPTDPLTLAAGVGGDLWRRVNAAAYGDRREVAQQPSRWTLYFDAGPGSPPLTLTWGAGGDYWHRYQWRRPARSWWQPRPVFVPLGDPCVVLRPFTGSTGRPGSGTTTRPFTGITADPC